MFSNVFCHSEQDYCESKPDKYIHYAGLFAVKEAVMKALGTGWNKGVQWKHIEIKHEISGKPWVQLHDQAKKNIYFFTSENNTHYIISY
ncbi:MAG: 4'-phosphopantetheinyl transferase superfamily protein [Tannerellaceae bacterium]|nr:4'-phosphopantetheinyl transferase superfamily protein [Tannerellaceae bacterium]